MSRPKGKKTAATTKQRGSNRVALSLATARKMLPLVSQIVQSLRSHWVNLAQLEIEQTNLDRRRRDLDWPQRSRRYQIAEDVANEQRHLQEASAELEQLSIVLIDPVAAEIAFPTIITGRRAYFIWKLGDDDVTAWCYAHDPVRHAIPASWRKE